MDIKALAEQLGEVAASGELRGELVRLGGPALAEIVRHMAFSGQGTDLCLERKCLPMQVHFYSPVPDIPALQRRGVFEARSALAGIDFAEERQCALLGELGRGWGRECDWPRDATGDPLQFHTHNGCFSYGCAAPLHCLLRSLRPRRVMEAGSGNSSLVINHALGLNAAEGHPCRYTIMDPFMRESFRQGLLPNLHQALAVPVEETPLEAFLELEAGDVLFIDSGHVVRAGGDVNFLILDVLPRLAPGVVVHFHDIELPFEYNQVYFTNPGFRVFWTEAYLLQAFLACNPDFEVLLAMGWLMRERMPVFEAAFPRFKLAENWANSGSFWIRRKG